MENHERMKRELEQPSQDHIEMPREIATKRAMINLCMMNNACFAWSVVPVLYLAKKYTERESSYPHYTIVLNLAGIEFPMTLKNIKKFEQLNDVDCYMASRINKSFLGSSMIRRKNTSTCCVYICKICATKISATLHG